MKQIASSHRDCSGRTTEKIKLLNCMLTSLSTVRLTANSNDFEFLSYLTEMAVLEAQREIHQAEMDDQQGENLNQRNAAADMPFKARR